MIFVVDFGCGDDVEVVATALMSVEIKLLEDVFVPSSGYGGPRSPQGLSLIHIYDGGWAILRTLSPLF